MPTRTFDRIASTVREQYERFPYPQRNPEEDRSRLLATVLDDLGSLNGYCYRGRKNFERGFRALVAGGGTGDATIYLAHQLQHTDAAIVHVDLSEHSLTIARQRAANRGLCDKIEWIQGSLLDLPQSRIGTFDYINCSGVLHHLADPAAGLSALRAVLKDDGAMGLMLYGLYGRTGVYQIQQLLRTVCPHDTDAGTRLELARDIIASLPATNWYSRGADLFASVDASDDAEAYDMFLHSQDAGFSIPDVYRLLDGAGLNLAEFTLAMRALYQPASFGHNQSLSHLAERLPPRARHAAAEIYWGVMTTHTFWATPQTDTRVDSKDDENVPSFSRIAELQHVRESILNTPEDRTWQLQMQTRQNVCLTVSLEIDTVARRFVELIDNHRTIGDILRLLGASSASPTPDGQASGESAPGSTNIPARCRLVVESLLANDLLHLRHKSCPPIRGN